MPGITPSKETIPNEWDEDDEDSEEFIQDGGGGFRPSFRRVWTSITAGSPIIDEPEARVEFRRGLKRLGYTGIQYLGGITMGGGHTHRAYVLWDEQGIKKYRVA